MGKSLDGFRTPAIWMMETTTKMDVTDSDIRRLLATSSNTTVKETCVEALAGDHEARQWCARYVQDETDDYERPEGSSTYPNG